MKNLSTFKLFNALLSGFAVVLTLSSIAVANVSPGQFQIQELKHRSVLIEMINNVPKTHSSIFKGGFEMKDGVLEEILELEFEIPLTEELKRLLPDSVSGSQKLKFHQTRAMVLPTMGMVHLIGTLEVGELRTTTSLHLGYSVNEDESLSLKGVKSLKIAELLRESTALTEHLITNKEVTLPVDLTVRPNLQTVFGLTSK